MKIKYPFSFVQVLHDSQACPGYILNRGGKSNINELGTKTASVVSREIEQARIVTRAFFNNRRTPSGNY